MFSLKDELLQSMKEILEKMANLKGKIEMTEQKIESRLGEVEKQINYFQSEMQNIQTIRKVTTGEDGDNALSPTRLPTVLEEVCFAWQYNV